ncbi:MULTISPECIES: PTS lactose/cellobiose transporter subunit IIA [Sporosarcina]|uniref:PTS lactose/cellobiose transporter subunit IIA n=1 Tax=Sporosarcina TaxID=1569 RepID=UPI00078C712C|nr:MULTISPECIES: PTS lactose/cellobiose transporter subunit IIA [Sporosarcina]AMQ05098.1 PTS mannose transporter subunit IIA [Sporosarcina psychrophila]QNK88803.1 PTS lactose/cellobiose transporter subunit IIA [Sporosarcina sp. resist]
MNLEEQIMQIILYSGNAKSTAFEAIQAAKENNFDQANELIEKANVEMSNAHRVQTFLIQSEIRGEKVESSLLLIHAQDHLMNAITFKDLAGEFIALYEAMNSCRKS